MDTDTTIVTAGVLASALLAQTGVDISWTDIASNLSSSGVLAAVFYWVMCRFEKRLDQAFTENKETTTKLLEILDKYNSNNKE